MKKNAEMSWTESAKDFPPAGIREVLGVVTGLLRERGETVAVGETVSCPSGCGSLKSCVMFMKNRIYEMALGFWRSPGIFGSRMVLLGGPLLILCCE